MSGTTYKCEVCGYIHTGAEPPETCPVCGVGAELFVPLEVVAAPPPAPAAAAWRCTVCDHVHRGPEAPGTCPVCGAAANLFEPEEEGSGVAARGETPGRIVIVGDGVAGITAAEYARQTAADAAITVVSREPGLPYFRLNLTRFLAREVTEGELRMNDEAWFERHRVERLEGEVVAIDREARQVRLRDGAALPYDRLVLANGSHPFVPPWPGVTRGGVHPLRTLADARLVQRCAEGAARCAVIGGGLLGLEMAGALQRRGVRVTVLEGFGHLLPRQLAEPAGRRLARHLEGIGIEIRAGVRVEALEGDEWVQGVRLEGGEVVPADLVVIATGVRPNSYLARTCDLDVGHGVLVDDRMATTDPAIFAAGDVAEHRGVLYGIWPASYAEGMVAGINAAGGAAEFTGLAPSNRLKVVDVDVYSIGEVAAGDGSYRVLERDGDGAYQRFVVRDGVLVGANLYGDTGLANVVREAVESGGQLAEQPELLAAVPELSAP